MTDRGVEVVRYDLVPDPAGGETVIGDVRDAEALAEAMAGCTAVANLAAAHHDFGVSDDTFTAVNVGGARAITAAMDSHGITNLCFTSSVAVYGEHDGEPDELTAPTPVNPYGRTKLQAERVYRTWQDAGPDRRVLVLRPAVIFGPRHFANVYRLISQIDKGRFASVGDGSNRKSMAVVTNLVQAIWHLWSSPPRDLGGDREVYNYADKPDLTSREVVATIYRSLGKAEPRIRIPLLAAVVAAAPLDLAAKVTGKDMPVTSARIRKLAQFDTRFAAHRIFDSGFVPDLDLEQALTQMVQWYLQHGRDLEPVVNLPPESVVRRADS